VSPEELALKLLGLAAAAAPVVHDFLRGAVATNPDHPLAKRVEDVLPATSRSREVQREIEGSGV